MERTVCYSCLCNIGRGQGNDWHRDTEMADSETSCDVISFRPHQPASLIGDQLTAATVSITD